ncbi:Guanine deaminase [Ceratobasidium theobromae]|uniref:Guanine deaminase n=1 Tax=Ceratobasidium theobromae TaxID=1582974 RepID=A0A5N5QKD7_9AGAM|nr:Guanine deaminase [Ceratobasidium theobromae]
MTRLFYGSVINPISVHKADFQTRTLLAVSPAGIIEWVEHDVDSSDIQRVALEKGLVLDESVQVHELKYGEWLMPGFVDTHTHAPQFPNIGIGGQYELLDWLNNVTFPTETRFADLEFAERVYSSVVDRVLNSGTTTCCYYGTLHLEATKLLSKIIHERGQRAFVGKCNMDRNSEPYQEPSVAQSIADTKALISYIRSLSSSLRNHVNGHALEPPSSTLVHPILTPRFAISCTPELLSALGEIASSDPTLAIQTHISENTKEIEFTRTLFPECMSYAHVYKHYGLLNERTILAHAVHLEDEEMRMVHECGAGVSHCPTSNFYLNSGVAPIGEMLDRGIKVGLGTDCSGGFSPSILTAVRDAIVASKIIAMAPRPTHFKGGTLANKTLPLSAVLYMSTLGGAQLCNLDKSIGSLVQGKEFDAVLVSVRPESGNPGVWANLASDKEPVGMPLDTLEALLEKYFFCGDDRNVRRVWVRGRTVGGAESKL